jgi:hypothetical protein
LEEVASNEWREQTSRVRSRRYGSGEIEGHDKPKSEEKNVGGVRP